MTKNMKKRIEEIFESKVFDMYGAMESGPIAFQCKKERYHIQADLVYLEIWSDDTRNSQDELGNIVLTRLYGRGTPIIRYDGLRDIIALSHERCNCGLGGRLIKKIYGRADQSILLPDNKVLLPTSLYEMIDEVSEKVDLDGIEFLTGYLNADIRDKRDYTAVPLFVAFDFDAKPLFSKIGLRVSGRLDFVVEPFINNVISPDNNIEAGSNFLIKYVFPLSSSLLWK